MDGLIVVVCSFIQGSKFFVLCFVNVVCDKEEKIKINIIFFCFYLFIYFERERER